MAFFPLKTFFVTQGFECLELDGSHYIFASNKLIIGNVRGLNNPKKRSVVKNLLWDWKCDVVCLQETKLSTIDWGVIRSLWSNPYVGWVALDVVNTAGGVLLMWDKRMLEMTDSVVDTFSVSYCWKGITDGFVWACTSIYGPNADNLKASLRGELMGVR
jgi:hypothetical protein